MNAQSNFFKGIEIGLSFGSIKPWRTRINRTTINSQRSINTVQSYSIEFAKELRKNMFVEIQYSVDREEHIDLQRRFFNSTYLISFGYKLRFDELNEFRPKIGWGVINRPSYGTAITEIQGRPDTRSVIHYFYGKEPFRNWLIGLDYRHNLSNSIFIGIGVDVTYNFNFRDGRTYLSPLIGFNLTK